MNNREDSRLKKPLTSDAAMKQIEENNTLVFLVAPTATRTQIKAAVSKVSASAGSARECGPPATHQARALSSHTRTLSSLSLPHAAVRRQDRQDQHPDPP